LFIDFIYRGAQNPKVPVKGKGKRGRHPIIMLGSCSGVCTWSFLVSRVIRSFVAWPWRSALRLVINYYWKANVAWPLLRAATTIDNSCTTSLRRRGGLIRSGTLSSWTLPSSIFPGSSPRPPSCIYKLFAVSGTPTRRG